MIVFALLTANFVFVVLLFQLFPFSVALNLTFKAIESVHLFNFIYFFIIFLLSIKNQNIDLSG